MTRPVVSEEYCGIAFRLDAGLTLAEAESIVRRLSDLDVELDPRSWELLNGWMFVDGEFPEGRFQDIERLCERTEGLELDEETMRGWL